MYLENIKESRFITQNKWAQELGVQMDDWSYFYFPHFRTTRNTKLQNLQFKISHRITATNSFLFKCGLRETELCTFCSEFIASVLEVHLQYICLVSNSKRFGKLLFYHALYKWT